MDIIIFLSGLCLGTVTAYLFWKRTSVSNIIHEKISREASEYKVKYEETDKFLSKLDADRKAELEKTQAEISRISAELSSERQGFATLEAEKKALGERIKENKEELEKLQEQFKIQFENMANKIFEEKTGKFRTDSEKSIGNLLNPLKEQIGQFQKKIDDSFGEQGKEQRSLKKEIENIVNVNEKMRFQTESLTKALKGDVKAQGNWGEIILERMLEASGFIKGEGYILQGSSMGLINENDGSRQKPDVILNLPEGKQIIIDSKVSLVHYERFGSEVEELNKAVHLKAFLAGIRSQIDNLSSKSYQDNASLKTLDYVFMFIPIDGAFMLALQHDKDLHDFAYNKRVHIVSPSTLFPILSLIRSLWNIDKQNKNVTEIARQGSSLYDQMILFLESMTKIDKGLKDASQAYEQAFNRLSEGKGNVIKRMVDLKNLSSKSTKKTLPKDFAKMVELEEEEENETVINLVTLTKNSNQ